MSVLGIIFIYILPFMVGTILNMAFKKKGASQIETYLIGFFFLFFIQGGCFGLTNVLAVDFEISSRIFSYFSYAAVIIFVIIAIIKRDSVISPLTHFEKPTRYEMTAFVLMMIAFILLVVRVILLKDYVREDVVLNTVKLNLSTGTINQYNPLTNRPYEQGLITSKKIITLTTYYTYLSNHWGIDARTLVYIIIPIQTIICLYFVYELMMSALLKGVKKKVYISEFVLGVMLLSGDYFSGAAGYRVLWNGYSGDIIVALIMITYVVHIVMAMYRLERGDEGEVSWLARIRYILSIMICIVASVFMTSIATGLLMLVLSLASIAVCCTWRFGREEKTSA